MSALPRTADVVQRRKSPSMGLASDTAIICQPVCESEHDNLFVTAIASIHSVMGLPYAGCHMAAIANIPFAVMMLKTWREFNVHIRPVASASGRFMLCAASLHRRST
jgi:hypothetical protein